MDTPVPGENGHEKAPSNGQGKPKAKGKGGKPWKDKTPGKKARRGSGSRQLTRQQADRRAKVANLSNQGKTTAQIAHDLGVDRETVEKDLVVLERMWHEHQMEDWGKRRAREIGKLELARDRFWQCFENGVNRHGETNLTGYGQLYLKACEQLTKLQQMTDQSAISLQAEGEARINLQFVTVESREELEEIQQLQFLSASRYKALLGGEQPEP